MNRRSLVLLSFVSAVIASCLWFAFSQPTGAVLDSVALPEALNEAPDVQTAEVVELPTPVATTNAIGESKSARVVVPSTPEQDTFELPDDALWIEGRVLFPDGTPYGEELTVEARGRRFGKDRDSPRTHAAKVASDGTFRLAYSDPTRVGLLSLSGQYLYLQKDLRVNPRTHEGELILEPLLGGRIFGQVHLPAGVEPSADNYASVQVTVWALDLSFTSQTVTSHHADGSFVIAAIPASEKYQVTTESPRFAQVRLLDQVVQRGEDLTLELNLTRGVRLSGHVLSKAGTPIAQSQVLLYRSSADGVKSYTFPQPHLPVDDNGHFDVAGIAPGNIRLTTSAPGFEEAHLELGEMNDGDSRLDLRLVPVTGQFISGIVLWPEGSPAANAGVQVQQESLRGEFDVESRQFDCKTNEKGEFRIDGLSDRALIIEASAMRAVDEDKRRPDRPHAQILSCRIEDARPGTSGLKLLLSRGQILSGSVVDDRGQVVERFTVQATPTRKDVKVQYVSWNEHVSNSFFNESGEFELAGLTPGAWSVRVKMRRGAYSAMTDIELPHRARVRLIAPRPVILSGVVRTPDGQLVSGAEVSVGHTGQLNDRFEYALSLEKTKTNANGEFESDNLREGGLRLIATAAGWGPSAALELTLQPGERCTGIEMTLRTPATIAGVIHSSFAPHEGQIVVCKGPDYFEHRTSDASGAFEFTGLSAGTFQLRIHPHDLAERFSELQLQALKAPVEVEVLEDETVRVVLGGPQ